MNEFSSRVIAYVNNRQGWIWLSAIRSLPIFYHLTGLFFDLSFLYETCFADRCNFYLF
jgi:hypothetical protein